MTKEEPTWLVVMHVFGYVVPFVLALVGFWLVPSMRYYVFEAIPVDEQFYFFIAVIVEILTIIAWILTDMYIISNTDTSGDRIKKSVRLSVYTALLFFGGSTLYFGWGQLGWWLLIPTIGTLVDAEVVTNRGVNSALLKRILQEEHH